MRLWAQRGKASVRGSAAGWTQVARLDHHSMRPWDGNPAMDSRMEIQPNSSGNGNGNPGVSGGHENSGY